MCGSRSRAARRTEHGGVALLQRRDRLVEQKNVGLRQHAARANTARCCSPPASMVAHSVSSSSRVDEMVQAERIHQRRCNCIVVRRPRRRCRIGEGLTQRAERKVGPLRQDEHARAFREADRALRRSAAAPATARKKLDLPTAGGPGNQQALAGRQRQSARQRARSFRLLAACSTSYRARQGRARPRQRSFTCRPRH